MKGFRGSCGDDIAYCGRGESGIDSFGDGGNAGRFRDRIMRRSSCKEIQDDETRGDEGKVSWQKLHFEDWNC